MTETAHIYLHYGNGGETEIEVSYTQSTDGLAVAYGSSVARQQWTEIDIHHIEVDGKRYPCPEWLRPMIEADIEAYPAEPDDLRIP